MKRIFIKKSKSFTLIEIIVSVAIFMVVVTIALATLTTMTRTHSNIDIQGTVQKESRFALTTISNDIKAADVRGSSNVFYYGFAIVDAGGNVVQPVSPNPQAIGYRLKATHYDPLGTQNITRVFVLYNQNTLSDQTGGICPGNNSCYVGVYDYLSPHLPPTPPARLTSPDINVTSLVFTGIHHDTHYYNSIAPFVTISMTAQSRDTEASGKTESISLQTTVAGPKDANFKSGLFTWIGPNNGNFYKVEPALNFQLGDTIYYSYDLGFTQCGGWPAHIPWTSQCQITQFPPAISDKSYLASSGQYLYAAILDTSLNRTFLAKFDANTGNLRAERVGLSGVSGRPQGLTSVGANLYLWLSDGRLYSVNTGTLATTAIAGAGQWPNPTPEQYSFMTSDGTNLYQAVKVLSGVPLGSTWYTSIRKINTSGAQLAISSNLMGISPRGLAHFKGKLYLWKNDGNIASFDDDSVAPDHILSLINGFNLTNPWPAGTLSPVSHMVSDGRYLYMAVIDPVNTAYTTFARFDPIDSSIKSEIGVATPTIGQPQGLAVINRKEY